MDVSTMWELAKPIVAGQIRTALATAGGAMVAAGALAPGEQSEFVKIGTGLALWAIPAAWSWWEKVGKIRLLALMAKSPPVAPKTASTGDAVKAAEAVAK